MVYNKRATEQTAAAIGRRMREIREASGHNRTQFTRLFGCGPQRWYNYEAGVRAPDLDLLIWLHANLGINLNWLLAGELPKAIPGRDVLRLMSK